ncbi:MAG: N-acetylmuramoyl-L-alanine amidase [Marinifilaceae bacterium]
MKIENDRLIDEIVQQVSCSKNRKAIKDLQFIVLHSTASKNLKSTINFLKDPEVKASAHIVIARDGSISQLVDFSTQAWHAGKSSYKGFEGLNKYSIGIELMNACKLKKKGDVYLSWFGEEIDKEEVHTHVDNNGYISYWHKYTEAQINILLVICQLLRLHYPSIKEIIGHSDITSRKVDPGFSLSDQIDLLVKKYI